MRLSREVVRDAAIGVGIAETPDGLSSVRRSGCAAAIWRRRPLTGFQSWLDSLDPEHLPRARVILRVDDVRAATLTICEASGTPECAERERLIDDIAALADIFSTVMGTAHRAGRPGHLTEVSLDG